MRDRDEKITLKDCKEQLTDWARELVDKEIRRRPEGLKLKQLEELKRHSIDTVMESGTPEDLLRALDANNQKDWYCVGCGYFQNKTNRTKLTIDYKW